MKKTLGITSLFLLLAGLLAGPAGADDPSDADLSGFIKKGPRPPDRVGERVKLPFPPVQEGRAVPVPVPPVATKPLEVARYQPEGKEQVAHSISVTFNQPMVAVSSIEEVEKATVPIRIEPSIPGKYRWAGTRTITFEPEGRIPFATRFRVTVPAGTRSAGGAGLAEPFVFFFDTPVPTVSIQPSDRSTELGLSPVIHLSFNTRVTPEKIARFVTLRSSQGKKIPLRVVPRETWKDDSRFSYWAQSSNPERRAIFTLARPLIPNTTYRIEVAEGLVVDEGPLPLPGRMVSSFTTYTPLKVLELWCQSDNYDYDRRKKCVPGGNLNVRFNHAIEGKKPERFFSVSPRPKGMKVKVNGTWANLSGRFKAGVTYRVKVRAGIKDQYSQVLKKGWSGKMPFVHLRPRFNLAATGVTVLEPGSQLKIPTGVLNLDWFTVMVYRVEEKQILESLGLMGRHYDEADFRRDLEKIKKRQVSSWKEKPRKVWDRWDLHGVSLKKVVRRHGPGSYLVVMHAPGLKDSGNRYQAMVAQVTDIGLTARYDNLQVVVLASSVKTGQALPGVALKLLDDSMETCGSGVTGKDGLAVIRAPQQPGSRNRYRLILRGSKGRDSSFLQVQGSGDDNRYVSMNWGQPYRNERVHTFLHADRDLYRPGEDVFVFGIGRRFEPTQANPPGPLPGDVRQVSWKVRSSRGRDLAKGTAKVTPFGRFHFQFRLPEDVDLGWTRIEVKYTGPRRNLGGNTSMSVRVEEYRAPEFKVGVDIHSQPMMFKESLRAVIHGDYLFGAPMRGAPVSWSLYRTEARFSAPNHPEFHFGDMQPYWHWHHHWHGPDRQHVTGSSGKLDDRGQLRVEHSLPDWGESDPSTVTLEAQVTDENRQVVAGRASGLVHPADAYVGIRLSRFLVESAEPFEVGLVVVDLDGKRLEGLPVRVRVTRDGGEPGAKKPEEIGCQLVSSSQVASCKLKLPEAGTYTLVASSLDSKERPIQSTTWIEAYGKGAVSRRKTDAQKVELMPDKREYRPGDTATVMIRAPFAEGLVLVSQERNGLLGYELHVLREHTVVVKVPIKEAYIPNLEVSATAVAARKVSKGKRPPAAWANGNLRLPISTASKRLHVQARPLKATARPGEKVPVELTVTDHRGQPVAAQVGLAVVDEAVLGMTGFQTPDPLPSFHFPRSPGAALAETLKRLMPELKELTPEQRAQMNKELQAPESRMAKSAMGADMEEAMAPGESAGESGQADGIAVRKFFTTTPLASLVTTDAGGKATLDLKLPDNLTTFRVMAVAADRVDRFGSGEARVTSRLPLLARPALPRFANYGDSFDAAVVINNETGKDGMAKVRLEVEGVRRLDPAVRMVSAPDGKATEVAFRVKAHRPGRAVFRFTVSMGGEGDAVELYIPVWVPATTEAFATYGTTTSSVAQPISPPEDALRHFGGLQLTLSSTALTGLQDAVSYLVEYPYECVEQTSSRLLPIFSLGGILQEFKIGGMESAELRASLANKGIKKLVSTQRHDGGWGTWYGSSDSVAHLTAYVLLVLEQGRQAGFDVPEDTLTRARQHLVNWMRQNRKLPDPKQESWRRRYVLDTYAMALYVLTGQKNRYSEEAQLVFGHRDEIDLFAHAMLAAVFHRQDPKGKPVQELMRELGNRVVETPSGIHFAEERTEALRMLMHSSSRTDAIVLLVLLEVTPEDDMIPKVVRALVDARIRGRWETTQANGYALLALSRYYQRFEAAPTEFTARMWLGKGYLGSANFEKKTMREMLIEVPMQVVFQAGPSDLVLGKDGPGKLYYRIGMSYAPRDLDLKAREQGFSVQRTYEAVDDPGDVQGGNDKGWVIRAGAYVRVHLLVVVPDRRYYAVVDDPLPAGLEIVNLAYKTSARDHLAESGAGRWYRYWISWMFNHRELRDDRALHFADRLTTGVYHVTYIARATTKGDFVVPPAKAEEMYRPEVFGRSGTDRVTVE